MDPVVHVHCAFDSVLLSALRPAGVHLVDDGHEICLGAVGGQDELTDAQAAMYAKANAEREAAEAAAQEK